MRDIERRIERAEQRQDFDLPELAQPEGIPPTFAEHVALMFDLQVLAHQIDLTRVTSFMMGREVSSRTYTEIGIADAHHPLSHHEYKPEKIASMSKINAYHASMFADYLAKLRATPDGDGSLLDNMLLLYGCGMSDSNAHSPLDLPVLLLGGCAGQLEGGRHIRYEGDPLIAEPARDPDGQARRPRRKPGQERRQAQHRAPDGRVARNQKPAGL